MIKTRICPEPNCNREPEKNCIYCSECAEINRQLSLDIARHNYLNTDHGKNVTYAYFKSDAYKQANRKRMTTDKRRAYKRNLYKKSKGE